MNLSKSIDASDALKIEVLFIEKMVILILNLKMMSLMNYLELALMMK